MSGRRACADLAAMCLRCKLCDGLSQSKAFDTRAGGYIEGEIKVSGFDKDQKTFARISGYVEQTDVHSPQARMHSAPSLIVLLVQRLNM